MSNKGITVMATSPVFFTVRAVPSSGGEIKILATNPHDGITKTLIEGPDHQVRKGWVIGLKVVPHPKYKCNTVVVNGIVGSPNTDSNVNVGRLLGNLVATAIFTEVNVAATAPSPTPSPAPRPVTSTGGTSGGVWGSWFRDNFGLIGPMLLLIFAATVAFFYNSSPARHDESMAYFQNEKIKKCGKAAEDGGIVPPGCEGSVAPVAILRNTVPQVAGVMTDCPAIQVGRFTVYDGTARKGCTAQGRGREQLRLKGNFTVTRLTDGGFVSFVNVRCDNFEYDGAQPVFTKQGDDNTHTCVAIGKPEDMPESMTYIVTSK